MCFVFHHAVVNRCGMTRVLEYFAGEKECAFAVEERVAPPREYTFSAEGKGVPRPLPGEACQKRANRIR